MVPSIQTGLPVFSLVDSKYFFVVCFSTGDIDVSIVREIVAVLWGGFLCSTRSTIICYSMIDLPQYTLIDLLYSTWSITLWLIQYNLLPLICYTLLCYVALATHFFLRPNDIKTSPLWFLCSDIFWYYCSSVISLLLSTLIWLLWSSNPILFAINTNICSDMGCSNPLKQISLLNFACYTSIYILHFTLFNQICFPNWLIQSDCSTLITTLHYEPLDLLQ